MHGQLSSALACSLAANCEPHHLCHLSASSQTMPPSFLAHLDMAIRHLEHPINDSTVLESRSSACSRAVRKSECYACLMDASMQARQIPSSHEVPYLHASAALAMMDAVTDTLHPDNPNKTIERLDRLTTCIARKSVSRFREEEAKGVPVLLRSLLACKTARCNNQDRPRNQLLD